MSGAGTASPASRGSRVVQERGWGRGARADSPLMVGLGEADSQPLASGTGLVCVPGRREGEKEVWLGPRGRAFRWGCSGFAFRASGPTAPARRKLRADAARQARQKPQALEEVSFLPLRGPRRPREPGSCFGLESGDHCSRSVAFVSWRGGSSR